MFARSWLLTRPSGAKGVGGGLLHRRGGVLPGNRVSRGARRARTFAKHLTPDLCDRSTTPRSTRLAAVCIPPTLRRRSPKSAWRGFSLPRIAVTASAGISATWWSSPGRTSFSILRFTRLDILSCRNLLIYLTAQAQKKFIPLFHYSVKPGGVLVLGGAETVGAFADLFAPLDAKTRIYHRLDKAPSAAAFVEFPRPTGAPPLAPGTT